MFHLLFLSGCSAPGNFCKVIQAAIEKFLFMQKREIVFGVSHIPGACSTTHSGRLECAQKSRRLVALCLVPLFDRRTSSKLFRCAMFACAPMRLTFSHLHLLERSLSHDRLGANGSHFGYLCRGLGLPDF